MARVAIYSRYSSENQRETSIEDQVRSCKQYAEKNNWPVVAEYADMEMSGRLDDRPQYKKLIEDAVKSTFDIVIVYDLSRLSRGTNTATLIEEFKFHGVRVISISDGIDSSQKGAKLQIGMKAIMNNSFLDQLKENVHRGLEGKALKGHNAGGRSYGYRHIPHFSTTNFDIYGRPEIDYVTKEIDEEQSKWVKQIFEWVADGYAYNWIAKELNRLKVKTLHGGGWTTSTICGSTHNIHVGILNNPLYIGIYYWNRTEKVYNPTSGKSKVNFRNESEWIKVELKHLRIVSDELWEKVKSRQSERTASTKIKRGELHHNARTGPGPKYLLSGIIKCDQCGGNFLIAAPGKYKCGNAHRRGESICTNNNVLLKDEIEENLLKSLKQDLFTEQSVNAFKSELSRLLKVRKDEFEPNIKNIRVQIKDIDNRIEKIIDAIETGASETGTLTRRLTELEVKKNQFEKQLTAQTSYINDVEPFLPRALDIYKNMVQNLQDACKGHAAPIREKLSTLLGGKVTLRRTEHGGWEGSYQGSYSGLIRLGTSPSEISDETL